MTEPSFKVGAIVGFEFEGSSPTTYGMGTVVGGQYSREEWTYFISSGSESFISVKESMIRAVY